MLFFRFIHNRPYLLEEKYMLRITILFLGLLIASSAFGQTLTIYRSTESVDKTVEKIVNEI